MSSKAVEVFATLYRGKDMAPGFFLSQLGNNILVAADENMRLLRIWSLNSQKEVHNFGVILTRPVSAIAISPDDYWLAIGVDTKLIMWNRNSEKPLPEQDNHFCKITHIKFSADAHFLITASEDGQVLTYNCGGLIMNNEAEQIEPLYSLTDHNKAVTDVHIGKFKEKPCFVTVSLDGTCLTYTLFNGQRVTRIKCKKPLTSVVFDQTGYNIFMGSNSGSICQFGFRNGAKTYRGTFKGHKEKVNCLLVNCTNDVLISGSDDSYVITWNICSQQILCKMEYSGVVYNIQILKNENFFAHNFNPQLLKELQATIDSNSKDIVVSVTRYGNVVFNDDDENKEAIAWEQACMSISNDIANEKCAG